MMIAVMPMNGASPMLIHSSNAARNQKSISIFTPITNQIYETN